MRMMKWFIHAAFAMLMVLGVPSILVAQNATPVIQPNVLFLPSGTAARAAGSPRIVAQSSNGITLRGNLPSLKPGTVLVSRDGVGRIAKVTSVQRKNQETVVQTTPGVLTDVYQSLSLRLKKSLGAGDFIEMKPLMPGVKINGSSSPTSNSSRVGTRTTSLGSITISFGREFLNSDSQLASKVKMEGSATITPTIDIGLDIDAFPRPRVTFARCVAGIQGTLDATISANGSVQLYRKEIQVARLVGATVYPYGVPITPIFSVQVVIDGTIEGGANARLSASLGIEAGLEYNSNSGTRSILNYTKTLGFHPNAYTNLTFGLTPLRPKLESVLFFGVPGPSVTVNLPRIELRVNAQTNPTQLCGTLDAVFSGQASYEFKGLLGIEFSVSASSPEYRHTFWNSCFQNPTWNPTPTPPPGGGPTPTPTPPPTTGTGGGSGSLTDNAKFVQDITYPDSPNYIPTVPANGRFTKKWLIRNTGSTTWNSGYRWTFDGAHRLAGPDFITVPVVIRPGESWTVSVDLQAPDAANIYQGFWRMRAPNGQKFGDRCWVKVRVDEAAPPEIPSVGLVVPEQALASNSDAPGFWQEGPVNWWSKARGVGLDGWMTWTSNAQYRTHNVGYWRPILPENRPYEVFAYIPRLNATTENARYTIYHANGQNTVTINQLAISDAWVSLGTYNFNAGSTARVRLIDTTGEASESRRLGFDTVKWEPRDAPPPPPPSVGTTVYVYDIKGSPDEAGFYREGPNEYWKEYQGSGTQGRVLWTYNESSANYNTGYWRPNLPETRPYEVFVHIPRIQIPTQNAQYTIFHANGQTQVTIPQSNYNDVWVSLGTYPFVAGTSARLRLPDTTGEGRTSRWVGYDAAKWEPRDSLPPPPPPVTTFVSESSYAPYEGAAGFFRHGPSQWWRYTTGDGDGGSLIWTQNSQNNHYNTGEWRPNLPRNGRYEVFVYIPHLSSPPQWQPNATSNARYFIRHAHGETEVRVDQRYNPDRWVSLGTYQFSEGTSAWLRLIDTTGEYSEARHIMFDSAKWESRPGNTYAPSDLQPRDGAVVGGEVNLTWHDNGMDDGNPSWDFKVQAWRVRNGQRGDMVLDSDWRRETNRVWALPGYDEYEWLVIASNGQGQSSTSALARFIFPVPLPNAPTDLRVRATTPERVELVWQDNARVESGFKVERKVEAEDWVQIGTTGVDENTFSDTNCVPDTTYTYRVRATNHVGDSAYSNEAQAVTAPPYPLISLTLTPLTVTGGGNVTGTVTIAGQAFGTGTIINLESNNALVIVPRTVTVPAGQTFATFQVKTLPATADTKVRITASRGEVAKAETLNIVKTPPTISITTPTANRFYYSLASAKGTASAVNGRSITKVMARLYRYAQGTTTAGYWAGENNWNTTFDAAANWQLCTGTTSWTLALPTTLSDGKYFMQAQATDSAGVTAISEARAFTIDKTAPVVQITNPLNNSVKPSLARIVGTASDNIGVQKVTARVYRYASGNITAGYWNPATQVWDDTYNADAHNLPCTGTSSWSLALPTLTDGKYAVRGRAYDTTGNIAYSDVCYFTIDLTAPMVAITAPLSNGSYGVSSFTTVTGTASDNKGVQKVVLHLYRYANSGTPSGYWNPATQVWDATYSTANLLTATGTTRWQWPLPYMNPGKFLVRATVRDFAGNASGASAVFTLTPPALPPSYATRRSATGAEGVQLSTGDATASSSEVQLTFTIAPAGAEKTQFAVTVNDITVQVQSMKVAKNTVTLLLADGALKANDEITVAWNTLHDALGAAIADGQWQGTAR